MEKKLIYCAGSTPASRSAARFLRSLNLPIADDPVKNVRWVLLDVPSFREDGSLRCGGDLSLILNQLPKDILICGGNLSTPLMDGYETVDFLKDEIYLCENARITAECALKIALSHQHLSIFHCPVLIVGWGRIGKCLAQLLRNLGADVTVAARNPDHRAMLHALGYQTESLEIPDLSHYRLILNTVPHPVLHRDIIGKCGTDCVKIELASKNGMDGDDIIIARGLPGIHMPESSGKLIAETFLRLCYGR